MQSLTEEILVFGKNKSNIRIDKHFLSTFFFNLKNSSGNEKSGNAIKPTALDIQQ